jgi:hypothetical protein
MSLGMFGMALENPSLRSELTTVISMTFELTRYCLAPMAPSRNADIRIPNT